MPEYEVIDFNRGFETDEDIEVVAAQLSEAGTRPSSSASNRALVKRPGDGSPVEASEGVDESYDCGAQTASGRCERTVASPDENCWQHADE